MPEAIKQELRAAVNQLLSHFETTFKLSLHQGAFYFKFDSDGQLYLVYATGLQASVTGEPERRQEDSLRTVNPFGLQPVLLNVAVEQ